MTTGAWEAVRKAVDAYDMHAVALLAAGFGDDERREVAAQLTAYLPVARRIGEEDDERRLDRHHEKWDVLQARADELDVPVHSLPEAQHLMRPQIMERWIEPLRVAGAATLPGAAAVAAWLNRRELRRPLNRWQGSIDDVPQLVAVLSARPAAWQSDLAVRLALRLRGARPEADNQVRLVLEMLRRTGAEPPKHDPLTLAWLAAATPSSSATLAKDGLLDAMVPRLFESEGVGRALRDSTDWPKALHKLTARSLTGAARVSRKALLSGCVRRFLRGGQAADLRFFIRLHDLLDPTDGEVAEHGHDYLRLLPIAPGNVAELALKRVRRLGELPAHGAGEAVLGLLFRQESKLVGAGLSWLERLLRDPAHDLDDYASALATALAGESAVVRERAVKLAVKHAARFTPLGAETIRQAVELLPADQGGALATAFGGEANSPDQTPAPLPPRPLPVAPEPGLFESSPQDLTAPPARYDWTAQEQWLDTFVRQAATDRAALTAALTPLSADFHDLLYWKSPWTKPAIWVSAIARELAEPGAEHTAPSRAGHPATAQSPKAEQMLSSLGGVPIKPLTERVPDPANCDASLYMPLARFAEVYQALLDERLPPYLLATPSREDGGLDAAVLVERLEGYAADNIAPLPFDLRQALLRLRRSVPDEMAAQAHGSPGEPARPVAAGAQQPPVETARTVAVQAQQLPGEAGQMVAREQQLRGETARTVVARAQRLPGEAGRMVAARLTARPVEPQVTLRWTTHGNDPRILAEITLAPEDHDLLADLLTSRTSSESCQRLLPALAGYRELVAARSVYGLLSSWPIARPDTDDLRRLALADGPGGPGMALLLAWSLLGGDSGRATPKEPFLWMAASGDLPAEEVGRQFAALLPRLRGHLPEALRTLQELAELGAHQEVWRVMTGLLPAYLQAERATTTHTRLVSFAADAAAWAGARGELPVITDLATRTRTSDLVRQARRLHTHLTSL
ncbi:hypothetical protein [Nonomuraea endophytica]|uniref:Secreted protein n=1 Tax=Nonomuraea endophytica TaxID=714136 RepID=A0A7W8EDR3_9ACTN|nr:hypothetical protein [Nonomuraea endophytica]MBB5074592.1 hypothetical protein [Nonomuraea endophytica]